MHLIGLLLLVIIVSARSEYFHLRRSSENKHQRERWSDIPGYYDSRHLLPDAFEKPIPADEYRQKASLVHGIPREYALYSVGRNNRNYSASSIAGINFKTSPLHKTTRPRWVIDTLESSNVSLSEITHTKWNEDTVDLAIKDRMNNASGVFNANAENARNRSMMASARILNGLPSNSYEDAINEEHFHLEEAVPKAEEELRNSWRRRKLRGAVVKELMRHKVAKCKCKEVMDLCFGLMLVGTFIIFVAINNVLRMYG